MKNKPIKIEVLDKEPKGFVADVEVAACYLEIDNKLLLLQRAPGKLEPGKWGVPAGKLEINENKEDAAKRELFEETGINLDNYSEIQHLFSLYITKPEVKYIYYLFKIYLNQEPKIYLSSEHQSYQWVSNLDIEKLVLMDGAKEAWQYYQSHLKKESDKK